MAEDPLGSCRIDFALLLQQIKSVRNGAAAVLSEVGFFISLNAYPES